MDGTPKRKVLSSSFRISNNTQFLCIGTTVGWTYFKLDENDFPQLEESVKEPGGCVLVSAFPVWEPKKQRIDYSFVATVGSGEDPASSSRVLQLSVVDHTKQKNLAHLYRLPFEIPILNIKIIDEKRIIVMTETELHICKVLDGQIIETISLNASTQGLLATSETHPILVAHAQTPFGAGVGHVILRDEDSFATAKMQLQSNNNYNLSLIETNADGNYIAVACEDGQIIKVRQLNGRQVQETTYQTRTRLSTSHLIYSMAFSSHRGLEAPLLALVSSRGTIHVFRLTNKQVEASGIYGSIISVVNPGLTSFWKIKDLSGGTPCHLAFSPVGRLLAVYSDGLFKQWTLTVPGPGIPHEEGTCEPGRSKDLLEKIVFDHD